MQVQSWWPTDRIRAVSVVSVLCASALVATGLPASPAGAAPKPARAGFAPAALVASTQRPGPDLLYAAPAAAPQLENTGVWTAPPILVSGAEKYDRGEFLYQDFLFDDHGAFGTADATDPFIGSDFSPKRGTLTYPTNNAVYANNAADLVEMRIKPLADATAFRVTLNTMLDSSKTAFTIALGDSTMTRAWPSQAGVSSKSAYFLTVHGSSASLIDASTGAAVTPSATVTVDTTRRQVEVRVPRAAWDPGTGAVRISMGTGLWDTATNTYQVPLATASTTRPGGASPTKAAIFNMAFRTNEPLASLATGYFNNTTDGPPAVKTEAKFWRERGQADVLRTGDVSSLSTVVDFAKLTNQVVDETKVPKTGHINRILANHASFGQGVDYAKDCAPNGTYFALYGTSVVECTGRYVGQLQPYALFVPTAAPATEGYGLVVALHSLSANYNQYQNSNMITQMTNRGRATLALSPAGRGPDSYWRTYAEADIFEAWADVARNYPLDSSRTQLTGYSAGGTGTLRLAARWPDLFARAVPMVAAFPVATDTLRSLRNVPVQSWVAQYDESAPASSMEAPFTSAYYAGIRFDVRTFDYAQHLTLANNDEYAPVTAFLGDSQVETNPAHVSYFVAPAQDTVALTKANHAYWVSDVKLANPANPGYVDVRSHGFGRADAPVLPIAYSTGTLPGGSHGTLSFARRTIAWGAAPVEAVENKIDVLANGVTEITIDAARAGLTCNPTINFLSTPVVVHILC
jgi:pimeloyl-ACP methyl ester carboxylesterase